LSGTNQKIFGATTFYNLTKDVHLTSADTLLFQQSNTQTIASGGTLTLKGGSGKVLTLRGSDALGNQTSGDPKWGLSVNAAAAASVDYVDVADSDASVNSGKAITQTNSHDSGNNLGWLFNVLSVASSVSIDTGAPAVNLLEGSTKTVNCAATVSDGNGYSDITTVAAKLYRSGVASTSSDDNSNHYTLSGSTATYCSGSSLTGTCSFDFPVQYYADPTDAGSAYDAQNWICSVTSSDGVGAGSYASSTIEMNTLKSIDVTSSTIDYGSLSPGQNTDTPATLSVKNTGNLTTGFEVYGQDLSCNVNSSIIPVTDQQYGLNSFSYGAGTPLLATPNDPGANISKPTQSTPTPAQDTYWHISVPAGSKGVCSGVTSFIVN
jgi:hypothetical protein